METRLSSDPVADDRPLPATEPESAHHSRPTDESTAAPPTELDETDETDADEASDLEAPAGGHADPDADLDLDAEPPEHEPTPETDPAMTFADMKLMRPLFDAV